MLKYRTAMLLMLGLLLPGSTSSLFSQDAGKPSGPPPGMDDMMKIMMQVATPGAPHKLLADLAGTWEVSATMFMPGMPASKPEPGTNVNVMVLGGRYLQSELDGTMMGMPMKGIGFMGYDNYNKKYFMFWIDNMGTTYSTSEGSADQSGKVITLYGKMDDPTTGENGKNVKYVYRILSKDKYIFEIHDLSHAEQSTKFMEVTYTRK
jgi:hypothetical protein